MCGYILLSGEGRTSRNLRLNYRNLDILQFQVARSSSAGVPQAIYCIHCRVRLNNRCNYNIVHVPLPSSLYSMPSQPLHGFPVTSPLSWAPVHMWAWFLSILGGKGRHIYIFLQACKCQNECACCG